MHRDHVLGRVRSVLKVQPGAGGAGALEDGVEILDGKVGDVGIGTELAAVRGRIKHREDGAAGMDVRTPGCRVVSFEPHHRLVERDRTIEIRDREGDAEEAHA